MTQSKRTLTARVRIPITVWGPSSCSRRYDPCRPDADRGRWFSESCVTCQQFRPVV